MKKLRSILIAGTLAIGGAALAGCEEETERGAETELGEETAELGQETEQFGEEIGQETEQLGEEIGQETEQFGQAAGEEATEAEEWAEQPFEEEG